MAIEAVGLRRRFKTVEALAGVSISVPRGEIYGFLGPNGAGKTTLLRILCTLLRPTHGSAHICGHDVVRDAQAVRLAIGVALQEAALDTKQTGRELLRLQGRLFGLHRQEIDRRITEILHLVDIGTAIDRRIGTYSGGMRRRLDLAAALVHNPTVLFLDEPTTGLDPHSRVAVWEEVRRLNGELGMTIFLTTQYLEEADALARRVGIIADGRLVREGTPDSLKRSVSDDIIEVQLGQLDHTGTFVPGKLLEHEVREHIAALAGVSSVSFRDGLLTIRGRDGARLVSPVALALESGGAQVHAVTLRQPTLDDVFMALTGSNSVPEPELEVGGGSEPAPDDALEPAL